MPVPTTTTGPTNVYFCEDDAAATANTAASAVLTAGGSGAQIGPEFTAPSAAAAIQIAHLLASVLQRPLRLINKYNPASGTPPWTLVQGAPANVALTVVPSGVGY
jgi:hypothetical protein